MIEVNCCFCGQSSVQLKADEWLRSHTIQHTHGLHTSTNNTHTTTHPSPEPSVSSPSVARAHALGTAGSPAAAHERVVGWRQRGGAAGRERHCPRESLCVRKSSESKPCCVCVLMCVGSTCIKSEQQQVRVLNSQHASQDLHLSG